MGQKIDLTRQVQGILPEANGGAGPNAGQRFSDSETPSGVINSSNVTFTLANIPNPALSLMLFLTRVLQIQGTDYTLSGNTITMGSAPSSGFFRAWYRYLTFGQALSFTDGLVMSDAFSVDAPASGLPLQPQDQLTITDAVAFFMATVFAPLSDRMTQVDLIQFFNAPTLFDTADQLILSDQLRIGYADRLSGTLAFSDSLIKVLQAVSETFADTTNFWKESLLFDLTPIIYQFSDDLPMMDSFAFRTFGVLTLTDFMTLSAVTDPFNATLSGVWTQLDGSLAYDGSTGLGVVTADSSFAFMKRNDISSLPTAQSASITVVAVQSAGNVFIGPMINIQPSGVQGYFASLNGSALSIWKVTGPGAATQLVQGGGGSLQFTVGDVMTLQNDGTGLLSILKNGSSVLTSIDHTYVNGTVGVGSNGGTSLTRVSTFTGGPLTVSGQADAVVESLM